MNVSFVLVRGGHLSPPAHSECFCSALGCARSSPLFLWPGSSLSPWALCSALLCSAVSTGSSYKHWRFLGCWCSLPSFYSLRRGYVCFQVFRLSSCKWLPHLYLRMKFLFSSSVPAWNVLISVPPTTHTLTMKNTDFALSSFLLSK